MFLKYYLTSKPRLYQVQASVVRMQTRKGSKPSSWICLVTRHFS